MTTSPLTLARDKKRPVQLYECAGCGKNIADEAVPVAVRIAAFVVPQATRDRALDVRHEDGTLGFDITDVGLPPLVRELVDERAHPDGHVYLGLGCFMRLMGPAFQPVNDAGEPVPIVPRAALDAKGIANIAYTGREHRDPLPMAAPELSTELADAQATSLEPESGLPNPAALQQPLAP